MGKAVYFNNHYWKNTITRNMSFWHQCSSVQGNLKHAKYYGLKTATRQVALTVNGTETSIFLYKEGKYSITEYLNELYRIMLNPSFMKNIIRKYYTAGNNLLKSTRKCVKNPTRKNYDAFCLDYERLGAGLVLSWGMGHIGYTKLRENLAKKYKRTQEMDEIIGTITYPEEHTPLSKSRIDLLKIGVKVQKGKIGKAKVKDLLNDWLKEYKIIPVNFCEDSWDLKDAESQLNDILRHDCKAQLDIIDQNHKKRVAEAKKELKKHSSEIRNLAKGAQIATILNEYRKNVFCRVSYEYRPFFAKAAKNAGLNSWKECWYLSVPEVGDALENKFKIKNVKQKRKIQAMTNSLGEKSIVLGKKDAKMFYDYIKNKRKKDNKTKEVKGIIANKGKVQGIAKVIFSSKDFHKFKADEILVTTMTSVDFISVMEKAAAFVTNEGGITCHAAIVSREMNKPCIIGTKNAVSVFKDGDLVEVDANNGVVKKIKKISLKKAKKSKIKAKIMKQKTKTRTEDILWFKDLNKTDIPTVGGKGANLGEMFKKFTIPNGFCITVNGYRKFMEETGIIAHVHGLLDKVNIKDIKSLDKTSKEIRKLILNQKFPEDLKKEILQNYKKLNRKVAVRSSATAEDLPTASFAGQQDTYLNVKGEKNIIRAVQKCWASLFTSRAIFYREKNNFKHRDVLISVVIQEMIDADFAGVMFTVDPVNKKFILIEVVEGLGEVLVSGQVTPNTYFIHKRDEKVMEKHEEFIFDENLIHMTANIGRKIEKHYKMPMDVEFALSKGEIYVLQARPITTL